MKQLQSIKHTKKSLQIFVINTLNEVVRYVSENGIHRLTTHVMQQAFFTVIVVHVHQNQKKTPRLLQLLKKKHVLIRMPIHKMIVNVRLVIKELMENVYPAALQAYAVE